MATIVRRAPFGDISNKENSLGNARPAKKPRVEPQLATHRLTRHTSSQEEKEETNAMAEQVSEPRLGFPFSHRLSFTHTDGRQL